MNPYLILGLPRSRTAWLANLLTYGPSFCWHDGLAHCKSKRELVQLFDSPEHKYIGIADAGAALVFDELLKILPVMPRIVIIRRNPGDVLYSCEEAGLPITPHGILAMQDALAKIMANHEVCLVDFEDLDKALCCQNIWHYCTRDSTHFNLRRWAMLRSLNVQIHDVPAEIERAKESAEFLASLVPNPEYHDHAFALPFDPNRVTAIMHRKS